MPMPKLLRHWIALMKFVTRLLAIFDFRINWKTVQIKRFNFPPLLPALKQRNVIPFLAKIYQKIKRKMINTIAMFYFNFGKKQKYISLHVRFYASLKKIYASDWKNLPWLSKRRTHFWDSLQGPP